MKTWVTISFIILSFPGISQSKQNFIINFDFNKHEITEQSKLKLDSFLQSSPASTIEKINLYGHCDFIGDDAYNDELSLHRVNTVKDYLLSKNISANIFDTVKGYGKREPLNKNLNEEERAINRRVEIIVERKAEEKKVIISIPEVKKNASQSLAQKIRDSSIKVGSKLVLKNLNFIGGRHFLIPQSRPVLEELLQVMQQNEMLEIEIQGHICCVEGEKDVIDLDSRTMDLSVQRAKLVYDYLIANGIERHRLSYKGFGHKYPLFNEDSEEHQALNRRVEIKIIKK